MCVFSVPWFPLSPPKLFDFSVFWCSRSLYDHCNSWDHLSMIRDLLAFALALPCPEMDDTFQLQCWRHLHFSIMPQNGSHSKFMDSPKWSECGIGEICNQTTICKVETPKAVAIDSRSYSQLRRPSISPPQLPCQSSCRATEQLELQLRQKCTNVSWAWS